MHVYAYQAIGCDGRLYSVRLLLEAKEFEHLVRVGLVPDSAQELLGMQDAADKTLAMFERQAIEILQ